VQVTLSQADAPTVIPWDLRLEQALYISKLSHVSSRLQLSDDDEWRALSLCAEVKKKLLVVAQTVKSMDPSTKESVSRLLRQEERGERPSDEQKPLLNYLEAVQLAFASESLRCIEEELKYLFMEVWQKAKNSTAEASSADKDISIECPDGLESLLQNRFELMSVVRNSQSEVPTGLDLADVEAAQKQTTEKQVKVEVPRFPEPLSETSEWISHVNAVASDGSSSYFTKLETGTVMHRGYFSASTVTPAYALSLAWRCMAKYGRPAEKMDGRCLRLP
jgi:hypothetical protein